MDTINFVDTTLRDGQQSLWACNMTTKMMLPVAHHLEEAGFESVELAVGIFFKKMIRELREDPWERLHLIKQRIPRTPLRVITTRELDFDFGPRIMAKLFIERIAATGIRQARTSDPSNTVSSWAHSVQENREAGVDTILNLIFSISPKHTDEYYAERTREAVKLKPFRVCLKDPGALLTPERVRTLVPTILANAGNVPVEIHTHCTTGLGPLCYLEAIKQGIRTVHTAVPPLANGSSNPSVFNIAKNARALGYTPAIDEVVLQPMVDHFTRVAEREGLPIGTPQEYDESHYQHQVPGGMISNLRFQLSQVGMENRLGDVLEEIVRVRAELGYPIMVTPYSQFVGVQAALNVMVGERYKEVTDQVIHYALGNWGEEERASIDPNVRDRILARARARELAKWERPELSLQEVRRKYGGPGISDDELLMRYFAGAEDVAAMRANPASPTAVDGRSSLVALLGGLAKSKGLRLIDLQKGAIRIRLESNGAGTAEGSLY